MKTLFVEPNGVLLFRDGRPFSAGDDHLAVGIFPPNPIPFYGALRSAMLGQHGAIFKQGGFDVGDDAVRKEVGSPASPGTLAITHFSLAQRGGKDVRLLFPAPRDVLRHKEEEAGDPVLLCPSSFSIDVRTNLPFSYLRPLWHRRSERDLYTSLEGVLGHHTFYQYLAGRPPVKAQDEPLTRQDEAASPRADQAEGYHEANRYYEKEPRTSIRINERGSTGEGQLFTVEFTRLGEDVGFALKLEEATTLEEHGMLRLGGEARSATYRPCELPALDPDPLRRQVEASGRFKLVLVTPAAFEKGWIPDGIMPETGHGQLGGCDVRLVGAAVGRYEHLGGWDLAKRRPKPTRRAVPAGSVYFFEIERGEPQTLFKTCFGHSIASAEADRKQGLGLAYLGTW